MLDSIAHIAIAEVQIAAQLVVSTNYMQGVHPPGKPGKVSEFQSGQGKVKENGKSQGKVRVTLKSASSCS